jgi:DNA-binding NarL/FixJ family response regulator
MAKTLLGTALSQQEEEIARLAASGLSNCELSERLLLSEDTIHNHLGRVYEKLDISTRIELILFIIEQQQQSESEGVAAA